MELWDDMWDLSASSQEVSARWDAAEAALRSPSDPDASLTLPEEEEEEKEPRKRVVLKGRPCGKTAVFTTPVPPPPQPRVVLKERPVARTAVFVTPDPPARPGVYVIGTTGRLRLLAPLKR